MLAGCEFLALCRNTLEVIGVVLEAARGWKIGFHASRVGASVLPGNEMVEGRVYEPVPRLVLVGETG